MQTTLGAEALTYVPKPARSKLFFTVMLDISFKPAWETGSF